MVLSRTASLRKVGQMPDLHSGTILVQLTTHQLDLLAMKVVILELTSSKAGISEMKMPFLVINTDFL